MVRPYLLPAMTLLVILAASLAYGADRAGLSLVFSGLLAILAAVSSLPQRQMVVPFPLIVGSIAWLILAVMSVMQGRWEAAWPDLATLAGAGAIYWVMFQAALASNQARQLVLLHQLALLALAIFAFMSFVTTPDAIWGQAKAYHQGRLTAAFLSANTAATLFAVAAVLALSQILNTVRSVRWRVGHLLQPGRGAVLPIVLFLFTVTCLVLTASRAGIMTGCAAMIALVIWSRSGRQDRALVPVLLFIGAMVVLGAVSGQGAQDRLTDLGGDDVGRWILWRATFAAFLDAPLFGHGLGRFTEALAPHITVDTAHVLVFQGAAHNLPLQWLVQTGIVGTIPGGAVIVTIFVSLIKGLRRSRQLRSLLRASVVILALVLVHGLVDYALEIPAILWWVSSLMGLGTGVAQGRTVKRDRRRTAR
ncbi:O-antigen ligase family protein [Parvularcula sp. LCG005]|uniref:O-antigen ligase family protein n=1 Tax=Parvularcula sp. LCG005 TaxID=3078805 RepID=UPI002943CCAF|nr:O-antigen ligase family protein [Parvularcula sp. LCG005]WOI52964.1 O-antigen ligase family protein [Parvularcula sp. LCG005]